MSGEIDVVLISWFYSASFFLLSMPLPVTPERLLEEANLGEKLHTSLIGYLGILITHRGPDAKLVVQIGNVRRELSKVLASNAEGFSAIHPNFPLNENIYVVEVEPGEGESPAKHYFNCIGNPILAETAH